MKHQLMRNNITREDLDTVIAELLFRNNIQVKMLSIGVEGGFRFDLGSREMLHENVGIGVKVVLERVKRLEKTWE